MMTYPEMDRFGQIRDRTVLAKATSYNITRRPVSGVTAKFGGEDKKTGAPPQQFDT